jgi:hypothetical protein
MVRSLYSPCRAANPRHTEGHHPLQNPHPLPQVTPLRIQLVRIKIPEGVTMSNLDNALRELREKRSHAQVEIEKLNQIILGIESLNGTGATPSKATKAKHTLSASARRRISLAQKARWASVRKKSRPTVVAKMGSAPAKRTMSATARRKIATAQKARWAKIRAADKKAA